MKYILSCAACLLCVFVFSSCTETPTDIGFDNFGSGDTLVIRTFDSSRDSTVIFASHGVAQTTTVSADVLLLGQNSEGTVAKIFLKFSFPDSLFDATVNTAMLILTPATYVIGDTTSANQQLNVYSYKVLQQWSDNATWDSLGAASVLEPTPRDTFHITKFDSLTQLSLDTAMVRGWFVATRDSTAPKNFGMALVPAPATTIAKAFIAQPSFNGGEPKLKINYQKPGKAPVDAEFFPDRDLYVAHSPFADSAGDNLFVQGGVGIRSRLKFDLSGLPELAHVNAVTLELTLKEKNLGYGVSDSVAVYVGDTSTALRTGSGYFLYAKRKDSTSLTYTAEHLFFPAEQWVRSSVKNYGLLIEAAPGLSEHSSLKRYVFFGPSADPAKRPRLRITYSYSSR